MNAQERKYLAKRIEETGYEKVKEINEAEKKHGDAVQEEYKRKRIAFLKSLPLKPVAQIAMEAADRVYGFGINNVHPYLVDEDVIADKCRTLHEETEKKMQTDRFSRARISVEKMVKEAQDQAMLGDNAEEALKVLRKIASFKF